MTFDEIADSSNREGQVYDSLKDFDGLNRMIFDGLSEKELEVSDKRVHHGLFVEKYLCL